MRIIWTIQLLFLLLCSGIAKIASLQPSSTNRTVEQSAADECSSSLQSNQSSTLRVVILVDITPEYGTNFRNQQQRLIKTLRHIDQQAKGHPRLYALVAFHRTAVVLSGLNSAQAKNVEKIISQINGLNPRRRLETAPSKAFDTAEELLEYHQNSSISSSTTNNIVLLIHDGLNTDLVNETFEAISKLSKHAAGIFAIAGNVKPNEQLLTEYTGQRSHVFATNDDMATFFQAVDNKIDPCTNAGPEEHLQANLPAAAAVQEAKLRDDKKDIGVQHFQIVENENNGSQKKTAEISQSVDAQQQQQQFVKREEQQLQQSALNLECKNVGKVDLMILLDTSGSVYQAFPQQRQIALQILHVVQPALSSMQVGVIQFAHAPTVIHSLRESTTEYQEMVNKVRDIVFTGRNTRIADALELAVNELDNYGRKDAQKILVLISDGHGQEFWHRAAEIAHRLETTRGLQRLAVSSSLDYNLEELILYMGDARRVFVGQRIFVFMPTFITLLNKCLPNAAIKVGTTGTNLDENGNDSGGADQKQQQVSADESSTAAAVDEFSTVANLSLILPEADIDNNNQLVDNLTQQNLTANFSAQQQQNASADMQVAVGKRDKPTAAGGNSGTTMTNNKVNNNGREQSMTPATVEEEEQEKSDGAPQEKVPRRDREEEETLRKVVPQLQKKKDEIACDTDVLIIVDRARPEQAFAQQVALAKHLVAKIEPEEIASGKTRIGIIAFGDEAKMEVGWGEKVPRRHILQKLDAIRQFNSNTSFVKAAKMAVEETLNIRRPDARLLITVFWSGLDGRDKMEELNNALKQFNGVNRTQIFAVSLNPKANLTRLKELAGDQWHVFVEGRASQFAAEVSLYLLDCVLPPSGSPFHSSNADLDILDNHEPLTSVERVEHLQAAARAFQKQSLGNCKDDLVDLALLLHFRPQNGSSPKEMADQFRAMRRAAMDSLRQAPADHYQKRIRLSLLLNGQVQVSLKTAIDLDDALFAIDRAQIDQTDGNVPLATKLQLSIDDLRQFHREGARVVLLVLNNDDKQQQLGADDQHQGRLIIKGLDRLSASLFILNFVPPRGAPPPRNAVTDDRGTTLSAQFNGSDTERTIRVFSTNGKLSQFVDEFRRKTFQCRKQETKLENPPERELIAADSALSPSEDSNPIQSSPVENDGIGTNGNGNETDTSSGAVKLLENVVGLDSNNNTFVKTNINLRATAPNAFASSSPANDSLLVSNNGTTVVMPDAGEFMRLNGTTKAVVPAEDVVVEPTTVIAAIAPSVSTTTVSPTSSSSTIPPKQQQQTSKLVKFAKNGNDHPPVFLLGDECKVDLMFIIDTSQSVQEAFDEQLQFAVDLVKRLPDQDFAQRVQVGVVTFYKKAQVHLTMGELKEKPAILDSLLHINHTGGGTSVVSGVNLAMDEVAAHRRNGTRLMVVLISDGSSQDPWADVLRSADRLRAAEADVYAVTVSHDYFFRELELYAGNKWFVYIDARIRQFLDEAEMSLMECKSPSIPLQRDVRNENNNNNDRNGNGTTLPAATLLTPAASADNNNNNRMTAKNSFADQKTATASENNDTSRGLPSLPDVGQQEATAAAAGGSCDNDPVDLMFIIDTSTSVQKEFYAEKNFALDLVRVLPEQDFQKRISIAMVKFRGTADIHFHFHPGRSRDDIIYDIERVQHTGGETSLAAAAELAFREIFRLRRPEARLIIVIITDGNSQDEWDRVKIAAKKLRATTPGGKGVFAVTLSEKYSGDELREYTGSDTNVYANSRIDQFIQEVGNLINRCPGNSKRDSVNVTPVPDVEASTTPSSTPSPIDSPQNATAITSHHHKQGRGGGHLKNEDEVAKARDENPIRASREEELLFDETKGTELLSKCTSSKIDLIIILDASTSRENVFEHQRELSLSLIERLPISREGAHVSTGIISFTNNPVLRQNLGLGRDRKTVRASIEDIKYKGGSTLTSKAVELALEEMRRGMRPDARQVIVLMNDGMSQDPWEQVLESSKKLANSGAQRFGVALGNEVDLRELNLYIGETNRIYRDGSTERFLRDIVALLDANKSENCSPPSLPPPPSSTTNGNAKIKAVPIHRDEMAKVAPTDLMRTEKHHQQIEFQLDSHCEKSNVDLLIMLDNVISSERPNANLKMNSNRFLLLDVLGSLPDDGRLRVALISAGGPRLEHRFEDAQDRELLAARVERIRPLNGAPNYAAGIARALDHYVSARRDTARGILLLVGNGNGTAESVAQRQTVVNRLRQQTPALICMAVDSGKEVDTDTLIQYTGSPQHVFPFEKNGEFAKNLFNEVTASDQCQNDQQDKMVPQLVDEIGTKLSKRQNNNNKNLTNKIPMNRSKLRDAAGLIRLEKETAVDSTDKLIRNQINAQKKAIDDGGGGGGPSAQNNQNGDKWGLSKDTPRIPSRSTAPSAAHHKMPTNSTHRQQQQRQHKQLLLSRRSTASQHVAIDPVVNNKAMKRSPKMNE